MPGGERSPLVEPAQGGLPVVVKPTPGGKGAHRRKQQGAREAYGVEQIWMDFETGNHARLWRALQDRLMEETWRELILAGLGKRIGEPVVLKDAPTAGLETMWRMRSINGHREEWVDVVEAELSGRYLKDIWSGSRDIEEQMGFVRRYILMGGFEWVARTAIRRYGHETGREGLEGLLGESVLSPDRKRFIRNEMECLGTEERIRVLLEQRPLLLEMDVDVVEWARRTRTELMFYIEPELKADSNQSHLVALRYIESQLAAEDLESARRFVGLAEAVWKLWYYGEKRSEQERALKNIEGMVVAEETNRAVYHLVRILEERKADWRLERRICRWLGQHASREDANRLVRVYEMWKSEGRWWAKEWAAAALRAVWRREGWLENTQTKRAGTP